MLRDRLSELIEPAVKALGLEYVGCELMRSGTRALLRVYIDAEGGVGVDECGQASRQIGAILDVEDAVAGGYDLEVSSPGIERPLFTCAHYQRYIGHSVKLRLRVAQAGRRNFTGRLTAVEGDKISLCVDEKDYDFILKEIEKTNLLFER